ncbi:hypothetical protein NPIL_610571 [Nephila pilipes]|uniref:Uncharacterized protein n=1 Tax=Nephila pilipes TaxID=299642 RepID=A0A8X6QPD1_NEPPI|nr:hypothetical protein NPIL_610571 [Nephila pilipes]
MRALLHASRQLYRKSGTRPVFLLTFDFQCAGDVRLASKPAVGHGPIRHHFRVPLPVKAGFAANRVILLDSQDERRSDLWLYRVKLPTSQSHQVYGFFRAISATVKQLGAFRNCAHHFLPIEHLDTDGTVAAQS